MLILWVSLKVRFMSFWKKIFGIRNGSSPTNDPDEQFRAWIRSGSARAVNFLQTPDEHLKAFIRDGAWFFPEGGLGIETKVPLSPGSRENCEQAIHAAIAEFDQLHPYRRVNEPVSIAYVAPSDGDLATATATIKVTINVKYKDHADAIASTALKDFFDVFQKHGLPNP